jgi:hypothetical protein
MPNARPNLSGSAGVKRWNRRSAKHANAETAAARVTAPNIECNRVR